MHDTRRPYRSPESIELTRKHNKAQSRARTRLAQMFPREFAQLMEEEKAKVGIGQIARIRAKAEALGYTLTPLSPAPCGTGGGE